MAAHQSHLTDLYEGDPASVPKYCAGYAVAPTQQCYAEVNGVESGLTCDLVQINPAPEEEMSIGSSSDDPGAASAVFQQLDNLLRQRLDGEIEQLKNSVHRILSDQQLEFAQAFGLHDDHSSSEATHVVPQSNYCDDTSSDECQLVTEDSSDSEAIRRYDYEPEQLCSNCKLLSESRTASQDEEETLVMNKYLIRLMTASSIISNTLKRKEYRT